MYELKYILVSTCNMTIQNEHDANAHILHLTDNEIHRAKLIEVHPSNISWHLLLAEIFNSPIYARTYHDQRVATYISVVWRESIRAATRVAGPLCDPF